MSITTVGDKLIHYEAVGRGEPLIFIHGWLGSWRYWWPSMQALSVHYRTFAFDLWGFGDSSKAPDNYAFADYVEMVDHFMERLGIARPATLVGHGLGAAVALRFAAAHPQDVERLAAVALPLHGAYLHDRLADDDAGAFIARVLGRNNSPPEVDAELRKTDPQAMNQAARELLGQDFTADLDNVSCPVLLIYGEQDPVVQQPRGEHGRYREPAEKRAYVTLEACTHFPMLEETAKFNRLLLDFTRADSDLRDLAPKEYWKRRTH